MEAELLLPPGVVELLLLLVLFGRLVSKKDADGGFQWPEYLPSPAWTFGWVDIELFMLLSVLSLALHLFEFPLWLVTEMESKGNIQSPVRSSVHMVSCGCCIGCMETELLLTPREVKLLLPLDSLLFEPALWLLVKRDSQGEVQLTVCSSSAFRAIIPFGSFFGWQEIELSLDVELVLLLSLVLLFELTVVLAKKLESEVHDQWPVCSSSAVTTDLDSWRCSKELLLALAKDKPLLLFIIVFLLFDLSLFPFLCVDSECRSWFPECCPSSFKADLLSRGCSLSGLEIELILLVPEVEMLLALSLVLLLFELFLLLSLTVVDLLLRLLPSLPVRTFSFKADPLSCVCPWDWPEIEPFLVFFVVGPLLLVPLVLLLCGLMPLSVGELLLLLPAVLLLPELSLGLVTKKYSGGCVQWSVCPPSSSAEIVSRVFSFRWLERELPLPLEIVAQLLLLLFVLLLVSINSFEKTSAFSESKLLPSTWIIFERRELPITALQERFRFVSEQLRDELSATLSILGDLSFLVLLPRAIASNSNALARVESIFFSRS
jgi:hypothetical protein